MICCSANAKMNKQQLLASLLPIFSYFYELKADAFTCSRVEGRNCFTDLLLQSGTGPAYVEAGGGSLHREDL